MKLQFSTRTLLLSVAFVGLWIGAIIALPKAYLAFLNQPVPPFGLESVALGVTLYAPVWLPVGLVGYALGRRTFSGWMLIAAAIVEAAALLATALASRYWANL